MVTMIERAIKQITTASGLNPNLYTAPRVNVSNTADAYQHVPIIREAVNMRVRAVSSIPVTLYNHRGNPVDWPLQTDPAEILRRIALFYDLFGFAVILPRGERYLDDLFVLNSSSIQIEVDPTNFDVSFKQYVQGRLFGPWSLEDVVYIRADNPEDDVMPGASPVLTALEAARLMHYQSRFAADYFEAGAMPAVYVKLPVGVSDAEKERVESWFKRSMSGLKSGVMRVLGIRGDIEINTLTPQVNTMAMPELSSFARQQVAYAFGIPQTLLEQAANYATRRQDDRFFWQVTIRPLAKIFEAQLNKQLFEPSGYYIELAFEQMDVFQEEEVERSAALMNLRNAGVPLDMAMSILGYDLPPDTEAELEEVSDALPLATDYSTRPLSAARSAELDELRTFKTFAVKRVKSGKTLRPFEAEHLPPTLAYSLNSALKHAATVDDVMQLFDDAESYLDHA